MTALHATTADVLTGHPFQSGQVFDPQELDVLSRAFKRSCEILSAEDDVRFRRSDAARYAREVLARVIIGQAASGNRDPVSLSDEALGRMTVR